MLDSEVDNELGRIGEYLQRYGLESRLSGKLTYNDCMQSYSDHLIQEPSFPNFTDGNEKAYNERICKQKGFLLFDRTHQMTDGFEVADLYSIDRNEFIAVKRCKSASNCRDVGGQTTAGALYLHSHAGHPILSEKGITTEKVGKFIYCIGVIISSKRWDKGLTQPQMFPLGSACTILQHNNITCRITLIKAE